MPEGSNWTRGGVKNCDHRGHIHSHRGQTFSGRGQNSHRGVRFVSKIKQEIPATSNVPESLVFSGFPDILFISFVSIKRFTFPHKSDTEYALRSGTAESSGSTRPARPPRRSSYPSSPPEYCCGGFCRASLPALRSHTAY